MSKQSHTNYKSVINQNKFSVMLLLLRRAYLYWKYKYLRKCGIEFIKRIHSPIEMFLDFCLNKSKLWIVLTKLCFRKFYKKESFLRMLRKMCKKYLWKYPFFFQVTSFQPTTLQKKHFCGYITRTSSRF